MMDMVTSHLSQTIQGLRRVLFHQDGSGLSDRELLNHFIGHRDEAAFAALVRRHGPVVWGVCCRIIGHHHDAEDAFQATFLVLARKAASIRQPEMLANWLFGVAHRTALKAKATAGKRRVREKQVSDMPEAETLQRDTWLDLEPLIDRELAGLPDKYRIAIILCDLQGKTGKEAAQQLKIPEGTVSSRLRTARVMLAKRLSRQGVTLSAGALAAIVSQNSASALAPTAVVSSTIKAAPLFAAGQTAVTGLVSGKVAALTEGVMKAMLMTKLKSLATVLALASLIAFGGGLLSHQMAATAQQNQQTDGAPPASQQADVKEPAKKSEKKGNSKADQGRQPSERLTDCLPGGSAPVQGLVSLKEGTLVVHTLGVDSVTPLTKVVDGKNVTSYIVKQKMMVTGYDIKDVKVLDVKGRSIDVKELPKLLKDQIVALIAKDGLKVDPLHLRLYNERTLLFLLPLTDPAPIIAVPAGDPLAMPGAPLPPPPVPPDPPESSVSQSGQ
jgi:RNA polymerase sigma factor (sigma-70 family)